MASQARHSFLISFFLTPSSLDILLGAYYYDDVFGGETIRGPFPVHSVGLLLEKSTSNSFVIEIILNKFRRISSLAKITGLTKWFNSGRSNQFQKIKIRRNFRSNAQTSRIRQIRCLITVMGWWALVRRVAFFSVQALIFDEAPFCSRRAVS